MRRITLVILLLAVVGLACKRRSTIRLDPAIASKITTRVGAVFANPAVDGAFDRLIAVLAGDREVRSRGEALVAALAADPVVSGRLASMLDELQGPDLQGVVKQIMEQNPGTTPDEIGELVSKRFRDQLEDTIGQSSVDASVADPHAPATHRRLASRSALRAHQTLQWIHRHEVSGMGGSSDQAQ